MDTDIIIVLLLFFAVVVIPALFFASHDRRITALERQLDRHQRALNSQCDLNDYLADMIKDIQSNIKEQKASATFVTPVEEIEPDPVAEEQAE